jgi:hypothetical protein
MSLGAIKLTTVPSVYKVKGVNLGNCNLLYYDLRNPIIMEKIVAVNERYSSRLDKMIMIK